MGQKEDEAAKFTRMQIPKGSELLARQIREAILGGKLAEGEMLPSEKELMQQLGLSRATVREGLRLLEAEGLITTRPGRGGGATVHGPTAVGHTRSLAMLLQFAGSTLEELFEAWRALVPVCARLAAQHKTAEQVEGLRDCLSQMEAQIGDSRAFTGLEVRLHMLIGHATNNAVLRIYGTSLAELTFPQIRDVPFTKLQMEGALRECTEIVDAIEAGDEERAEQLIAHHLQSVEKNIMLLTGSRVAPDLLSNINEPLRRAK